MQEEHEVVPLTSATTSDEDNHDLQTPAPTSKFQALREKIFSIRFFNVVVLGISFQLVFSAFNTSQVFIILTNDKMKGFHDNAAPSFW